MADYNLFLASGGIGGNKGGGRFLEDPATCENIRWQTRAGDLAMEEETFAAALTQAFSDGADSLDACAADLNQQGLSMPTGAPWTAEGLGEHLARLSRPGR